jgi:hypothetical protein
MILTLIISQLIFSFTRTLNVRYVAQEKIFMAVLTSSIVKISWLVSTAIGINSMINLDILLVLVFVISGVLGDWFSFLIPINNKG